MSGPGRPMALLLSGQAVTLGLSLAFLVIPGTAIFLEAYGSQRLPFVYLGVGAAGAVISVALSRAEQRLGLATMAVGTMVLAAAAAGLGWLGLALADITVVSAGVLVLFAIHLQLGFVFIGGQAGRAFDVGQIKTYFPRIVAGFVFGFMVGGIAADPVIAVTGRAVHLLLVATVAIAALATQIAFTTRRLPPILGPSTGTGAGSGTRSDGPAPDRPAKPAGGGPGGSRWQLLSVPLVGSVFAYQVLSAMGTQLVEYLVYDQAAQRYDDANELASFVGRFTAVLNLTDLVALLAVGGLLMTRYGLRFGLGANPIVVTALVGMAVVVSATGGSYTTTMFVLAGVARVSDLTMADLATRTSVNATFQALPPRDRVTAQVAVEGAGVPLALGLTAALLLGLNALSGGSARLVVVATAVVCLAWSGLAIVVYRRYRHAVVAAIRRETFSADDIDFAEPAARRALVEVATTGTTAELSVAARLLDQTDAPELAQVLETVVADHDRPQRRRAVLDQLVAAQHRLAAETAFEVIDRTSGRRRQRAVAALGRLPTEEARDRLWAIADDDDPDRATALAALLARGGDGAGPAEDRLRSLADSDDTEQRLFAVRVIGVAGRGLDPDAVARLADDDDPAVALALAEAMAALGDADRAHILDGGDRSVRWLRAALRALDELGPATTRSVKVLAGHERIEIRRRAVRCLVTDGRRIGGDDPLVADLIADEGRRVAHAGDLIEQLRPAAPPSSAAPTPADPTSPRVSSADIGPEHRLIRALEVEANDARQHLLQAVALVHGRSFVTDVERALDPSGPGDPALAREALEVTLGPPHRTAVLRALGPGPRESNAATDSAATDSAAAAGAAADSALAALIADPSWAANHDWLQACALAVATAGGRHDLVGTAVAVGPVAAELQLASVQ